MSEHPILSLHLDPLPAIAATDTVLQIRLAIETTIFADANVVWRVHFRATPPEGAEGRGFECAASLLNCICTGQRIFRAAFAVWIVQDSEAQRREIERAVVESLEQTVREGYLSEQFLAEMSRHMDLLLPDLVDKLQEHTPGKYLLQAVARNVGAEVESAPAFIVIEPSRPVG